MSTPQPASDKRGMGPGSADHLWMGEHPQNSSLKAWGRTCYISPKKRNGVSCRTAISSAAMLCLSTAKNILHLMSITVFVRSASQLWVQGFHHECRLLTGCSGEQATYCKLTGHSSQTRSPSCTATSMGLAVALCSSSGRTGLTGQRAARAEHRSSRTRTGQWWTVDLAAAVQGQCHPVDPPNHP